MSYRFLIETYETERLKTLSVWSMFRDEDLEVRPHPTDRRGRSIREQLVHQSVSERIWFETMLGIPTTGDVVPARESRVAFLSHYAEASAARLDALRGRGDDEVWWETEVPFFEARRQRHWIMVRRIAHSAHHRGQLTTMLRQLGLDLHSTYGPTADTGGLMQDQAPVVYAYDGIDSLLEGERAGGRKHKLPARPSHPVTERPGTERPR